MIQQMMMLMRIEMQLRHQTLFNFHQSPDSDAERVPRFDDALALNSQLSEISSVLATLIRSTSVGQRSGRRRPTHRDLPGPQRLRRAEGSGFARSAALRRLSNLSARQWRENDVTNDDSSATDDDDDSGDDDEVLDMNIAAPENDAVDDFIWQQLTGSDPEGRSSIDNIRSSPDGMSSVSSLPDIQSISSIQSLPGIHSVPSNQSVSASISNISSYASSVPAGISYEGRQISPRYMLCMNNCEQPTAGGQCLCQLCTAFDGVAVVDVDEDDQLLLRSRHTAHPSPLLAGDGAHETRPRQVDLWNPPTRSESGAADMSACPVGLSESVNGYQSGSGAGVLTSTAVNRHLLQPVVPAGRDFLLPETSRPAFSHESIRQPTAVDTSPLSLPPGAHRPPHLNYAARLRRQASEVTRLPSEVSIRPWPLSDSGLGAVSYRLTSPSGFASRRVGPNSRTSVRQLPTYLPPRLGSVVAASAQHGGTHRGRARPSRYNSGDPSRTSRP